MLLLKNQHAQEQLQLQRKLEALEIKKTETQQQTEHALKGLQTKKEEELKTIEKKAQEQGLFITP